MEFSLINLFKLVSLITVLLLVSSIVLIFIKRFRKTGTRMLGVIFSVMILGAVYFYFPRHFKRNYLSEAADPVNVSFRRYADSLHFFIGAVGSIADLGDPRFCNNFNSTTPETALKLGSLLKDKKIGEYDFTHADSIVDLALEKHLRVRGHVLVWGKLSDMFKSPDLQAYLDKFPENERDTILWNLIDDHITTVLNHFRGRIGTWEVVNEPLATWGSGEYEKNVFYRYLGKEYIPRSFILAHKTDPELKLFLNEFFLDYHGKRSESFIRLLKELKEKGVPVYGVGIQSHVISADTSFDEFRTFVKKITDLGLVVEITELDARLSIFRAAKDPYKAQGEYYGKMLKACLENPMVRGITFWGFSDAHSWYDDMSIVFPKPNEPYLFDPDMHPKPAFYDLYNVFKNGYK